MPRHMVHSCLQELRPFLRRQRDGDQPQWTDRYHSPHPFRVVENHGKSDQLMLVGDCYVYTPSRGVHWSNTLFYTGAAEGVQRNHGGGGIDVLCADGHATYQPANPVTFVHTTTKTVDKDVLLAFRREFHSVYGDWGIKFQ